ncbi:MAG: FKBP-type peptidyl-prolyl cis-trans isomerase [Clostridia bacterium]|nr:FKBP-type peptidyl-prolyl cis-trans isomerase [Clostridia bacterium]
MKKFTLALVLVLALSVVLCSCGKEDKPYDYDLDKYVTIGDFPNVEIDMDKVQEKVDEAVENIAKQYAENLKEGTVEDGDTVNIDYVGKIDGKEFSGGSAKGTDLKIGSKEFIDGFESGLIGKKIGEKVDLNLVFPDDYKEELAGKAVVFTVTINSVKARTNPDLTDKMVEEKTDYLTVSEFLKNTKKETIEEMLWDNYLNSCKVLKYPKAEVKEYYDSMLNSYRQMAVYNGMTLEAMVTSFYGYKSVEEFAEGLADSAMLTVKEEMIIWQTVRKHDISLTDEEYKTLGEELAKEAKYDSLAEYEEATSKTNIKLQLYMDRIIEMSMKANDAKINAEDTKETSGTTTDAPSDTTADTSK